MSEVEFKRGDVVYLATFDSKEVQKTCPVCFGQRCVTVILGDGTMVQTPCDYCGLGYGGPTGFVREWTREPLAEPCVIESVTVRDTGRRIVEYGSGHFTLDPRNTFPDQGSAMARALERKAEYEKDEAERSDRGRANTAKKATWSIGYHMREAKRDRESAERHEARVVVLKEGKKKP